jgi:septal ring factor EnvC (AmiA/AmiB activator)
MENSKLQNNIQLLTNEISSFKDKFKELENERNTLNSNLENAKQECQRLQAEKKVELDQKNVVA